MRSVLLAAYAASAAARFGANNAHVGNRVAAPPQPWFSSPSGEADRVTSLPGMPAGNAPSQLYSGYIDVSPQPTGRSLFYTFQTSSNNPELDPIVLWLNGGPGCSSLGGGWMSELGPFFPDSKGNLVPNKYAWTSVANIIFLESPAGVGYSYFNTSSDATVGDARTAADAREFLLGFQAKFPGFAASPLYITGESYAGHYVPTLAKAILDGNEGKAQGAPGFINLEAIMIGNAWTDAAIDNQGAADHWHAHYHISTETHDAMLASCDFSRIGPLLLAEAGRAHAHSLGMSVPPRNGPNDACDDAVNEAQREIGSLSIYQMFADVPAADYTCDPLRSGPIAGQAQRLLHLLGGVPINGTISPMKPNIAGRRLRQTVHGDGDDGSGFPAENACIDDAVEAYMNTPAVRDALHVRPDAPYWTDCTRAIDYSYEDLLASVIPVHQALIATKAIRILIFSGDVDGIVPTSGSRAWVESLGLAETSSWHPWYSTGGDHFGTQVGGYAVEYEGGFSFATVRGAGHMVPAHQGQRGLDLFKAFLNKQPL